MADIDAEIQLLEQHRLIEQLKSMIRDRDDAFKEKETELQDVNAKLSKLKLQTKAKLAREAREAKGDKSATPRPDNKDAAEEKAVDEGQEKTSRGKCVLLKRRLEEKERQIAERQEELAIRDQQILAKERVISERDAIISDLTQQLADRTTLMEEIQAHGRTDGGDAEDRVQHMYDQILYKDRHLMEMNSRLLEQERRIIDVQELVGEKHEVIRGRDKVIQLLQVTIKENGENTEGQAMLISKLTAKVESSDETLDNLKEHVKKAEHGLKLEREQFDLRLTESQKYFEETLKEHEQNISKLRKLVQDKEEKLLVSENDLRELIVRQEKDIQKIMEKGVDIQDPVIQMLEQKLKDINHVLEGKIKVIEVLQRESSQKEKELIESQNIQKNYKDRLQVMSEQMMLFQANFADMESQWQEERQKFETKIHDISEKHEQELMEKDLQIETVKSAIGQYESLYEQSMSQYEILQERYDQSLKPGAAADVQENSIKSIDENLDKLQLALKEKEQLQEELECVKQQTDSLHMMLVERETEINEMKKILDEKEAALDKMGTVGEHDETATTAVSKAQLMSEVEFQDNESAGLRKEDTMDVLALQNRLAELEDEKGSLQLKLVDFDEAKILQGELESQLLESQARITAMDADKQAVDAQLHAISDERESLNKTISQLQDALNQNQLKHDQNQLQQISDLEMEARCKGQEVIQLQDELKVALETLETENSLVGQLRAEKVTLEVRTVEAEEQKDGCDKDKLALEERIRNLSHTIEIEMQQPLIDIEKERNELRDKVVIMEGELEAQNVLSKQQKEEKNSLTGRLSDVEIQLTSEKHALEQNIADLEQLKEEHLHVTAGITQELNILKEEKQKTSETLYQTTEDSRSNIIQLEGKLAEIQSLVDKKNKAIQSLESVNSNLKQSESELQEEIQYFVCEIGEVKSSRQHVVESLERHIVEIETKLTELVQNSDDLQQELSNRTKEIKILNESKSQVVDKLREKELELKQHVREMDILKEGQSLKGEEFKSKSQSLLCQLTELENEYSIKTATCDKQQAEIDELHANMKYLQSDINALNSKLEEDISSRTGILSEKENEIKGLDNDLIILKETCEVLENQKQFHESEIKTVKGDLVEITEEKNVLENKLQSEKDVVICSQEHELKLQQEINYVQNLIAEKDLQIQTLQLAEEEYSQECSKKDLAIQDLKNEYSEILSEKQKLEHNLADNIPVVTALSENLKTLNEELGSYQQQDKDSAACVEDLKKTISDLSMEHAAYLENINCLRIEIENANHCIENLDSVVQQKDKEHQTLLGQLQESCNKCISLESANSDLQEQNNVLERELCEIKQFCDDKTCDITQTELDNIKSPSNMENVNPSEKMEPMKYDFTNQLAGSTREIDPPQTSSRELTKQVSGEQHVCDVMHEMKLGMQHECEYEHVLSPLSSSIPQVQFHNESLKTKALHFKDLNLNTSSEIPMHSHHVSCQEQICASLGNNNMSSDKAIEKLKTYTECMEREQKHMAEKLEALSELNAEQLNFIETLQNDIKSKSKDLHSMEATLESQNESKAKEIEQLFSKIEQTTIEGKHHIAKLEKQLEQLRIENDELVRLKVTVMRQTENMTDRLNMLEAEVNPKEQTVDQDFANISFGEAENMSLCENVGGWKSEFNGKCSQIHELITSLQTARQESDELVQTVNLHLEIQRQETESVSLKLKQSHMELVRLKDETTVSLNEKEIQIHNLKEKYIALEEEISIQNQASHLQKIKLQDYKVDKLDKMSQIDVYKHELDDITCENNSMKVLFSDLKERAKECETVLEKYKSENISLRCELETSQNMLADKLSQFIDLNLNIDSITRQTSDEINMLKCEIHTLTVDKKKVETNYELIQNEVCHLKQQISSELAQKDHDHDARVKEIINRKMESERELSAVENTVSQIQMELQQAVADINEKDLSIESYVGHISRLEDSILLKEKQLADAKVTVENFQDEMNMTNLECDSLKNENKNIKKLKNEIEKVVQDTTSELEYMKDEMKCEKDKTCQINQELTSIYDEIFIKNEKIEHLTSELYVTEGKCKDQVCQINIITAYLDETKNNVDCAEASSSALQIMMAEKEALLSTSAKSLKNLEQLLATSERNIATLTQKLADAEHTVIQRDKELNYVNDSQRLLDEQLTEMKSVNSSLKINVTNCYGNISLLEEELLNVKVVVHEKEKNINNLNTASAELKMKIMEMQNDNELSVQTITELKGSHVLSINRCSDLETEILYNKQEFANHETHIAELHDRVILLTDESDDLSGQVDELRQRLCAAENVIDDLESRVSSLIEELENGNAEKSALQTLTIESASSYSKLKEDYSNLVNDNSLGLSQITDLQKDLASKCKHIVELEQKLNIVHEDNSASLVSIDSLKQDCVNRENTVNELEKHILQITSWKEGAEKEIDSLKDNLIKKEAESTFLNSELVEALQEKKELSQTLDELKSVKDNLEVQNDDMYQDSVNKAQTICDLMSKMSELENDLSLKAEEAHLLEKSKEEQIKSDNVQVKLLSETVIASELKVDTLSSQLKELNQTVIEKENEISNLVNNVQELEATILKVKEERNLKIELLAENVSDLVTQIELYTRQKDDIQSELNDAQTNLHNTEAVRGELEEKLTFSDKCLEENSAELTVLQGQFSSLSSENNDLLLASAESEKLIIEKNCQIESLSFEKQDMLLSLSQKDKLLHACKEEIDTLNKSISKLEEIMFVNREIIDEKEQEVQQIKNELSEAVATGVDKTDTITKLNHVICTLKDDISSHESIIANLQEDVTTAQYTEDELFKKITNTDLQINILKDQLTEMNDQHISTIAVINQLNCKNNSLDKKKERYEERIDEAFTKESELKGFLDEYVMKVDNHDVEKNNLTSTIESIKLDVEQFHELFNNEKDAHNETKLVMESVINEKDQTMKTLEAQIKILCDEKESLNEKLISVDSESKQLNCQNDKILSESHKSQKKQLEEMEQQLLEKFQWLSELRQQNEKKDRKLVENQKKICDLDKQNIMLKSDFSNLQEQYRYVVGQMDENAKENKELLMSMQHIQFSMEELELRHETENQHIKQLVTSETDLKFEVEVLKMELLAKKEEVEAIDREKSNIYSMLKNAEAKSLSAILELETEKDSLVTEIEETNASHLLDMSRLEHDANMLKNSLNECKHERQSFNERLNVSVCHANELEDQLANMSHCNMEKDEQIVTLTREIYELKIQNTHLGNVLNGLQEDFDTLASKNADMASELKCSKAYVSDADQRITSFIESSEALSVKNEERNNEIARLCECLDNYKTKNDRLLNDIAKKDYELLVLSDSLTDIAQTTMSDKSVLSHLMSDLKRLSSKVSYLIESVIDKDEMVHEANSHLEKTRISLINIESNLKTACCENSTFEKNQDEADEDVMKELDDLLSSVQHRLIVTLETQGKCENQLETCYEENLGLKSEKSELAMKINMLESEISMKSHAISSIEENCSKLKLTVNEKDSHIEYLLQSSHCITESITDKDIELKVHLEANKRLEEECCQLSNFLTDKEKELTETSSRLSSLEQRLLELKQKGKDSIELKQRCVELNSLLSDKDTELLLQLQKIKQLDESNDDLTQQLSTNLSQNEIIAQELTTERNNTVSVCAAINKMHCNVRVLDEKVNQVMQSESELEARVHLLTNENCDVLENNNKLLVSLDVSNNLLEEKVKQIEILNKMISEKNALMTRTASESDSTNFHSYEENERLNEKVELVQSQLNEISGQNNAVLSPKKNFQNSNYYINSLQDDSDTEETVRLGEREFLMSDIAQENSALKAEVITLEGNVDISNQKLDDVNLVQQEIQVLVEKLKLGEDLKLKQDEMIKMLHSDVNQLRVEKDCYEDHVTELSVQHRTELDNTMKKLSIAEAMTSEQNLALEEKMTAIKKLEVSIHDTENINLVLEKKMEELSGEINKTKAAHVLLSREHRDQMCMVAAENSADTSHLVTQVEEFKQNLIEKENEIESLKHELTDNLSHLQTLVDSLEKEKFALTSRVSSLETQVTNKDGRIKLLTMHIESTHKTNTLHDTPSRFDHAPSKASHEHYRLSFDEDTEFDIIKDASSLETSGFKYSVETDDDKTTSDIASNNLLEEHIDKLDFTDLVEKFKLVEQEGNKFKADNRKLIKVSKGKDAKLRLMNINFEHIRNERDGLLAERDRLENQVQLANSQVASQSEGHIQPMTGVKLGSSENKGKSEKHSKEQSIGKLQMLIKGRDAKIKRLEIAISESNVLIDNLKRRIDELEDSDVELKNELERALLSAQQWQEQCQHLESSDLAGIIEQKDIEIISLKKDHILLKKVSEEKIILEFELQCAKDELKKMRLQHKSEGEMIAGQNTELDNSIEEQLDPQGATVLLHGHCDKLMECVPEESKDVNELFDSTILTTDEIKSKVAAILHENKTLLQEKRKLQKLGKGKGAKLKRFEEVVTEQESVLKSKETDIVIFQESAKELSNKVMVLEETENDMQLSLDNLLIERDEWRNHCHALEDELDVAHESIDRKNEEIMRMDDDIGADRETFDGILLERDSLERDNEELISELEDLRTLLLEKDKDIEYYQEQLDNLSKEKDALLAETKKLQMVGKGKSAKVKKLEESFQAQESVLNERESLLASFENQLQEMKTTLGNYEHEKSELQIQLNDLHVSSQSWYELSKKQEMEIGYLNNQLALQNDDLSTLNDSQKDQITKLEMDMNDIQEICKVREDVLAEHCALINSQNDRVSKLDASILSKENKLEQFEATIEERNKALKHMTDVAYAWESRCNECEQRYLESQTVVSEKISEFEKLSVSYISLENSLDEVNLQIKGTDETVDFLKYSNNNLTIEIQDMKSKRNEKDGEIKIFQEKYKALESTIQDKEDSVQSLNKDFQGVINVHEQAELTIKDLTSDNQMLEQNMKLVQQDYDEMKQMLEEQSTTRNDALNAKCQAHEKQFHKDIELIKEKDNDISKLHKKITNLNQQCELDKELLEKHIVDNKLLNKQVHDTISDAEHVREHLTSELTTTKSICEEQGKEIDDLKQRHNNGKIQLDTRIQDVEMKSIQLQQHIDQLIIDKAAFGEQLDWYAQFYNDSTANINASQEKNQSLEISILELKSLLKDKDEIIMNKNAEYANDVKQKQKENLDLQDMCFKLEQTVKDLEEQLHSTADESKIQFNQLNESYNALSKENEAETISFEHIMKDKDDKLDILRTDLIKVYAEIKEQQCQINELTDENTSLLSQHSELSSSNSDLQISCANKGVELSDLQNVTEKLKDENVNLHHTFLENEKESKVILELKDNCQLLRAKVDNYEESLMELSQIKEHNVLLKNEVIQYTIALEEHLSHNSQLETNYSALKDNSIATENRLKTELEVLNSELAQLRQDLITTENRLKYVQSENDEFVNLGKLKEEEILNARLFLNEKIIEHNKLVETNFVLQQTSNDLKEEKQMFENLLKSDKEEIQSLYEQMNDLVSEKLDLECSLHAREKDLKSAEASLHQLTMDNDVMTEKINQNEELLLKVETMNRDLAMARDRLKSRDEELLDLAKFTQEKEAEVSQLNERLAIDHEKLLDKTEKEILTSEKLTLIEDEYNSVMQELESKKEATRKLNDMCLEKDLLIESLKETINETTDEIEKSHRQCSSLHDEISLHKKQLVEEENKTIAAFAETMLHLNRCSELESELKDVIISNELKIVKLAEKDNEIQMLVQELDHMKSLLLEATEKLTFAESSKSIKTWSDNEVIARSESSMSRNEGTNTTGAMDKSEIVRDINLANLESLIVQDVEEYQELDTGRAVDKSITEPQSNLHEIRPEIQTHLQSTDEKLLTHPDSALETIPHHDSMPNMDSEPSTTSIRKLQEELQIKSDEISRLTELAHKHEGDGRKVQEKEEKIASLLENMQEMEERLSQLASEDSSESLQDELRQKTEEIESLEKLVAEKEVKFTKALATAKKIKIQLNKTAATLAEEKNRSAVLEKEIDTLKSEHEASDTNQSNNSMLENETMLQDLQSQLLSYSEFCQQLQGQVQDLTDTVHKSENTEKQLQDSVTTLHDENIGLNNMIAENESKELEMRNEMKNKDIMSQEKEKMNVLLQGELDSTTNYLRSVEDQLKSSPSETMLHEMKQCQSQLQEARDNISSLSNTLMDKESGLRNSKQQLEEMEQQVVGHETTIQLLQNEVKCNVGHGAKLHTDFDNLQFEFQTKQIEFNSFIKTQENRIAELSVLTQQLQSDLIEKTEEYAASIEKLKLHEQSNDVLQQEISNKNLEIDNLNYCAKEFASTKNNLTEKEMKLAHLTDNLNHMSEKITERENYIETLNTDLINLKSTIKELEDSLKSKCIELEDTVTEKETYELEKHVIDEERQVLRKDTVELKEKMKLVNSECASKLQQMAEIEMEFDSLKCKNQHLTDSVVTLEETLQSKNVQLETLKNAATLLEQVKGEILKTDSEAQELTSQIKELTHQNDEMIHRLELSMETIDGLKTELHNMDKSFEVLNAENNAAKLLVERSESELNEYQNTVDILNNSLAEKDNELTSLNHKITTLNNEIAMFESTKQSYELENTTIEELKTTISGLNVQIESISAEKESALNSKHLVSEKLSTVETCLADVNKEKSSLFEDLSATNDEIESLKLQNLKVAEDKDRLVSEINDYMRKQKQDAVKIGEITCNLESSDKQCSELSLTVKQISERNLDLEKTIENLNTTNTDCSDNITSLNNEIETLLNRIQTYHEQLQESTHSFTNQKSQYDSLLADYEHINNTNIELQQTIEDMLNAGTRSEVKPVADEGSHQESDWGESWEDSVIQNTVTPLRQELQKSGRNNKLDAEKQFNQLQEENIQPVVADLLCSETSAKGNNNAELENLKQEFDSLSERYHSQFDEYTSVTEKLQASETKCEKMLTKLKMFKDRNDNYLIEVADLKQHLASMERTGASDKDYLQHQSEMFQNQVESLQDKLLSEESLHQKEIQMSQMHQKDIENKIKQIQLLEQEIEDIKADKNQIQVNMVETQNKFEKQINITNAENVELQNRNIELLENIDVWKHSVETANATVKELQTENKTMTMKIKQLTLEVSKKESIITELRNNVQDLKNELTIHSIDVEEQKQTLAMSQRQVKDIKEQYDMLEKDNQNFQELLENMSKSNNDLKNINIRQKMLIENLQSEQKDANQKSANVKSLETSLHEMETEKGYLEEDYNSMQNELVKLVNESKSVNEENRNMENMLDDLQSENAEMKQTMDGLNWKIDELKSCESELELARTSTDNLAKDKKDLQNEVEKLCNEILQYHSIEDKLGKSNAEVLEKDQINSKLKEEIDKQNKQIEEMKQIEQELKSSKVELSESQTECASLKKHSDRLTKKLQTFDMLKEEYETLNDDYNKLLHDNSGLAKQIEELHTQLKSASTSDKDHELTEVQKQHFVTEKNTLLTRIDQLESQCQEMRNKNSEFMEAHSKLKDDLQRTKFELDSLQAKQEALSSGETRKHFHGDYEKLQQQFNVVMQQKNKIQKDLHLAEHSLSQREARCQQLAMQVSQLAEDRSYLNVELAALSKSLREKEQEASLVQTQYRKMYRAHVATQAKIAEMERNAVLEVMQRSSIMPNATISAAPLSPTTVVVTRPDIEQQRRMDSEQAASPSLAGSSVVEKPPEISWRDRLGEDISLDELSSITSAGTDSEDGDISKIRERRTVLTRRGNTYLNRLQRWMSLGRSLPPDSTIAEETSPPP